MLELPSIFSPDAVLQRGRSVWVRGRANPGAAVAVRLGRFRGVARADPAGGEFLREVPAADVEAVGGPLTLEVRSGEERLEVGPLRLGEVWLLGGQSNMSWPVLRAEDPIETVEAGEVPGLFLFQAPVRLADAPAFDGGGRWAPATPASVSAFSAVGLQLGRRLVGAVGGPVGLIHCSRGGTHAEAWLDPARLAADPALRPILDAAEQRAAGRAHRTYLADLAVHAELARRGLLPEPSAADATPPYLQPPEPPPGPAHFQAPGRLHFGMLRPLAPWPVRGFVWYQGEGNTDRAEQYRTLLPALMADWRERFRSPNAPFGVVQLPEYAPGWDADGRAWAPIRDAQRRVAEADGRAGCVVALGLGDRDDIHPRRKQPLGDRVADWALAAAYGVGGGHRCPHVLAAEPRPGGGVSLRLSGPVQNPAGPDAPVEGFEARTQDGWAPVAARLTAPDRILLEPSPGGEAPSEVRHAWLSCPEVDSLLREAGGVPLSTQAIEVTDPA